MAGHGHHQTGLIRILNYNAHELLGQVDLLLRTSDDDCSMTARALPVHVDLCSRVTLQGRDAPAASPNYQPDVAFRDRVVHLLPDAVLAGLVSVRKSGACRRGRHITARPPRAYHLPSAAG